MSGEAYWVDLRPILQDMADRIARIEQFLAASGLQAPTSGPSFAGGGGPGEVFDSVPASFGASPVFSTPDQIAAASAGISPLGPPQPGVVPADILLLARSGKKIQAIGELRKRTGVGLKEAKDIIDQAARGY
jgi:hypothetical protein